MFNGCASIADMRLNIENQVEDRNFESRISKSQEFIVEARLLLVEGNLVEAKKTLDQAYTLYPRQASLHSTYQNYYEQLGNHNLASLAIARYEKMVNQSNVLNQKGRHAMVKMDALDLAGKLFNLSIIYHDENVSTLVNIAMLGYTTGDYELASSSLRILNRLNHFSPEASLIEFLVADAQGDATRMQITKMIIKNAWPDSPQRVFIDTATIRGYIFDS
jgi:tetratricopeptide (TPR) repeat protein